MDIVIKVEGEEQEMKINFENVNFDGCLGGAGGPVSVEMNVICVGGNGSVGWLECLGYGGLMNEAVLM